MAALHLVKDSPLESRSLERCLARAGAGDAVLLFGDAVYAVAWRSLPSLADGRVAIHVLSPDLEARGFDPASLPARLQAVDYPGFVALTARHNPIVSWI